ncbi:MAG: methylmalonyl Co-A mutase-associated GTPase MeaB [Myxococcota bacterium]
MSDALIDRVQKGETRAVARALRMVDDRREGFVDLLRGLYPATGDGYVLGITGNPGAGKSTLVDRLIRTFRAQDKRVAVVAVDPTSPFSGGAILGDRIRMQNHFLDEGVFIRSLATRGALGGLSRSAADAVHVLDAAGFDVILVETVGVGQDELEVAKLAETTLVVMAPGMGDDIQAIKAGILEVADVFAVNKADRDGADSTVRDLEQMVALTFQSRRALLGAAGGGHSAAAAHHPPPSDKADPNAPWSPPIVRTVATKNQGIDELFEAFEAHRSWLRESPAGEQKQRDRVAHEFYAIFRDAVRQDSERTLAEAIPAAIDRIVEGTSDPYSATEALLRELRGVTS